MKQEINFSQFCDAFPESRENTFSYEGKEMLFNYLEEFEELELDIVALCCDFTEYDNVDEYLKDYSTDIDKGDFEFYEDKETEKEEFEKEVLKEIEDKTTLLKIERNSSFIIQCY